VLERLSETEACGFEDLFGDGDGSRPFLIVTFLALLEMIRLKLIRVFQSGGVGPIPVYKRARPADAPHPIGRSRNVSRVLFFRPAEGTMSNETLTEEPPQAVTVSAEVKAVVDAPSSHPPEPMTPRMLFKLLAEEPKEDVLRRSRRSRPTTRIVPGLRC
jgi:hypothetical protein